jgi:acetoacetyl-CoA reductase
MSKKKVALITGGVGGIGTAISRCLLDDGFTLVANYALAGTEQRWLDSMRDYGCAERAHLAYGDVADYQQMGSMVKQIESDIGPVDVLINCAGITRDSQFRRMQKDDWDAVINVNLNSVFNVTRHVIDGMVERGFGRIVNISSVNGQKGQFGQTNYSAAKAGMLGFTKALAQEVVKKGVTVNAISPGYVNTDLVMSIRTDVRDKILADIPMGRFGKPEEIGKLVSYLVSEHAAYITGATISINGGQYMV